MGPEILNIQQNSRAQQSISLRALDPDNSYLSLNAIFCAQLCNPFSSIINRIRSQNGAVIAGGCFLYIDIVVICTQIQLLSVHRNSCYLYIDINVICTQIQLLFLHRYSCYLYIEIVFICTQIQLLSVNRNSCYLYIDIVVICTQVQLLSVHRYSCYLYIEKDVFCRYKGNLNSC